MARVKNGAVTKARHKKVLKEAKGYFGSKHRLYKTAKEQLMHSGQYAFRDRRQKKRDFRKINVFFFSRCLILFYLFFLSRRFFSSTCYFFTLNYSTICK